MITDTSNHNPLHRDILLAMWIPTLTWYSILSVYQPLQTLRWNSAVLISSVVSSLAFFSESYSYWLLPTYIGQVLYRKAEIWVWNTRGKVMR